MTLFSMFSDSGKRIVLRPLCFGKLPLARDFLKSRGDGASRSFQDWVNALARLSSETPDVPRTQRVLFIPEGEKHFVVATIWNSSDGTGTVFPFALYCEPSQRFLDVNRACPVMACLRIWSFLESEQVQLARKESTEDYYAHLRKLSFPVSLWGGEKGEEGDEAKLAREAGAIRARDLATGIFGEDPLEEWVRLLWRFSLAIRQGDRGSRSLETLALRLPLARGIPFHLQVEAWLRCARKHGKTDALVPSVIFPQSPTDERVSFCLHFRPLRESDVLLLQEKTGRADLLDLTVPDADMDVSGYSDFHEAMVQWFDRSEANLRNLLPNRRRTVNETLT